jgi:hypothetical protein
MGKGGFPTGFDGGLPLGSKQNKRTPGRGKGARGPTINPEREREKRASGLAKKAKGQAKRPAVGR